jgi:predicted fused transcriptional regulator/phosphomethylpyrimidine kinase
MQDSTRKEVITQLGQSIATLEALPGFAQLVPEVGSNFVYCLPNAIRQEEVAGLTGRIILVRGRPKACGEIDFGWAPFMGRVVLAAHKMEATIRSAISLRSSADIITAFQRQGLEPVEFQWPGGQDPPNCLTLTALEVLSYVPAVLYDQGAHGLEALTVVFGENPKTIVEQIQSICESPSWGEGIGG